MGQDLEWNLAVLMDQFKEGLAYRILNKFIILKCSAFLHDVIHQCLHIVDGYLQTPQDVPH